MLLLAGELHWLSLLILHCSRIVVLSRRLLYAVALNLCSLHLLSCCSCIVACRLLVNVSSVLLLMLIWVAWLLFTVVAVDFAAVLCRFRN